MQAKRCIAPKRMKTSFRSRIRDGLMSSRSDSMLLGLDMCVSTMTTIAALPSDDNDLSINIHFF
jgi:hypothetical protein